MDLSKPPPTMTEGKAMEQSKVELTEAEVQSLREAGLERREGVLGLFLLRDEEWGEPIVPAAGITLEGRCGRRAAARSPCTPCQSHPSSLAASEVYGPGAGSSKSGGWRSGKGKAMPESGGGGREVLPPLV